MTNPRAGAVVYASDIARLRAFYETVCGLTLTEDAADFATLTSDAWELHLVAVPPSIAATIEVTTPPLRRTTTPVKLVFEVASLARARASAAATGGIIDGPEHEWKHGDVVVCDGHDPEGNVVQLRERAEISGA